MGEKHVRSYLGIISDRMAERVDISIWECSHDEVLDKDIGVLI